MGSWFLIKLQATSPEDSSNSWLFSTPKKSKPSWKQGTCSAIMTSWKLNISKIITDDVGCVHMLMYNARVLRRLPALWSYNGLGLTNLRRAFLDVAVLLNVGSEQVGFLIQEMFHLDRMQHQFMQHCAESFKVTLSLVTKTFSVFGLVTIIMFCTMKKITGLFYDSIRQSLVSDNWSSFVTVRRNQRFGRRCVLCWIYEKAEFKFHRENYQTKMISSHFANLLRYKSLWNGANVLISCQLVFQCCKTFFSIEFLSSYQKVCNFGISWPKAWI